MAEFTYTDLKKKYNNFLRPIIVAFIGGKRFSENKGDFDISDIEVELTSDFEASIASFTIYNSFNKYTNQFRYKDVLPYIALGSPVVIYLGYEKVAREVLRGFIAKVNFEAPKLDIPGIRITAMDVKGLMMSGSYSRQLLSDNYGDAVAEILKRTNYEKIKKDGISSAGMLPGADSIVTDMSFELNMDNESIITEIQIDKTPDKKEDAASASVSGEKKVTDKTIEMVNESDYEFVVKAAKKFNYEFFSVGGKVYFRRAKSDQSILTVLSASTGMRSMDTQFDITGLVGSVEVRGIDVSKGTLINSTKKLNNKISKGSKATGLIKNIEHVVIDPTITSKEEANSRADFLVENISYRLGTLQAEFTGMPELIPGRFIRLDILGSDNKVKFYITSVIHRMTTDNSYTSKIIAKAASLENCTDS